MIQGSVPQGEIPTQQPIGPTASRARNPRALLRINDIIVRKIDSVEYIENNYYQPDSFRVQMPLYNAADKINIEYWLGQDAILVEVFVGFPSDPINYGIADLQSLVLGGVNDLNVKIFDGGGGFVVFNGFDLSKKFQDNKIVEKFQNQTSSQIAITLANRRGLTPVVTATTTHAGTYYTQNSVQLGTQVTEWDLLTFLAQQEGFQVFVRGTSLYFQPRPVQAPNPYLISIQTPENGRNPTGNISRLNVSRNLNYARDVIVNVSSMNANSGRITATARGKPNKRLVASRAESIGQAQTFDYFIPGLSQQQALTRAQNILNDISQHERLIEVGLPGDNILRKDSIIKLQGVCPAADQIYYPDTIRREIGGNGSYIMDVRAKNHSPQSTVII